MVTQEMIDQFYKDVESLNLRFPVAELHRKTGFSKGQISQVLNKALTPSEDLIKEFNKSFKNVNPGSSPIETYERMLEEKEKMIAEKEARRLEAKEWAERAEKEKDRLLTIIEKNLTVLMSVTGRIDANLKEAQSDLFEIENSQRVQHTVMMHSLERIEGEPGKLDKELDTLERASPPLEEQSGKS
jgi:hypothetical protein